MKKVSSTSQISLSRSTGSSVNAEGVLVVKLLGEKIKLAYTDAVPGSPRGPDGPVIDCPG
jgi:hypothetical protein